ncbi:molecular chaperone DjlA [Komagataeibacter nataicola]|uniref:Molecular chaperone DjlA n=1 Tax=Komagataeibacter nataicola TaxID=265960 RepID=A0A9N7C9Q8_9PROT|nr:TerB family tellurite resistance protein [Komagataeibacter nataicola]AQU87472.1 molecular chaperone DjlA [Komagataeibacter nataicola]PYD65962.1 molecular chaperone DjlA [Komagataeibacter nataicola]WEQ55211.1 TerB family tellurite resistance protein [Komagataeibacter nataicola]GBR19428.1 molecular chaperone DnaJ [Komagataeibacter nataicola NRIC 0616]
MAIWGKIFGGVAGFAVGGPMGAVVGTALGHAADNGSLLETPAGGWTDRWGPRLNADPNGAATFMAAKMAAAMGKRDQMYGLVIIILSAKVAKCDGPVNRAEIDAFKRRFQLPPENMKEVGRLFDNARQRTDDYKAFATELGRAFANKTSMLEEALAALFVIARADGELNMQEEAFLRGVHRAFNLSPGAWDRARDGGARPGVNEIDAYEVLGISRDASNDEVRVVWRRLVREHHPDVLSARGASEAMRAQGEARIAQINAAWDRIKRDRKL